MTGCGHDLEIIMVGLPPVIDAGVTKVMEGEVSDACLLASVLVSRPVRSWLKSRAISGGRWNRFLGKLPRYVLRLKAPD